MITSLVVKLEHHLVEFNKCFRYGIWNSYVTFLALMKSQSLLELEYMEFCIVFIIASFNKCLGWQNFVLKVDAL